MFLQVWKAGPKEGKKGDLSTVEFLPVIDNYRIIQKRVWHDVCHLFRALTYASHLYTSDAADEL